MRNMRRFPVVGAFVVLMMVGFGASPGKAQSRAHVYLLRGLMNIFSLGMDTLAEEIQRQEAEVLRRVANGESLFTMLNFDEHLEAVGSGKKSKLRFIL